MIKGKDGKEKVAQVWFRAEDSARDEIKADEREEEDMDEDEVEDEDLGDGEGKKSERKKEKEEEGTDEEMIDGKLVKVGKISGGKDTPSSSAESKSSDSKHHEQESDKISRIESSLRGGPGEGGVESYGGQGRESTPTPKEEQRFVRWSSSTEIGDFIRDAARGKEFAVEIEGSSKEIRVGVPSFNDRTHYLRVRLRKTSRKLADMASVKKECDNLAHRSAQRLAMVRFFLGMSGELHRAFERTIIPGL